MKENGKMEQNMEKGNYLQSMKMVNNQHIMESGNETKYKAKVNMSTKMEANIQENLLIQKDKVQEH